MLKLLPLLLLLIILATRNTYAINEMPLTISQLDFLLAQHIIITDPDSKFYPDNAKSQPISEFYGKTFQIALKSYINLGPLLTNLLLQQNSQGTIPRITLQKEPFSYNRPFNFYSFDYIKTIENLPADQQLLMLTGPPRSGKTLSLRYLYELGRYTRPDLLSIFIDLPNVVKRFNPSFYENLSIDDILNVCVSDQLIDLVKNLLRVQPNKIKLLFDDVDQVPSLALKNILNIIHTLGQKGVRLAIAYQNFNVDISKYFNKIFNDAKRQVAIQSEIFDENLREYMTQYWINKFASKNVQLDKQLVDDYYTALEIIMQNSPMPRNIATMEQLADYFSDATSAQKPAIVDVSAYALKSSTQRPELSEIFESAEKMHFPKMAFYDKYFQNLNPHEVEYYRVEAVRLLCEKTKLTSTEWLQRLYETRQLIQNNLYLPGVHSYVIINRANGQITDFVHEEYLYYFAGKEILASFVTPRTPYTQLFLEVLKNIELSFVAEYINERVEDVPALADTSSFLWQSIQLSDETAIRNVLNNLLRHGLDALCSKVFEKIGLQRVEKYLSSTSSTGKESEPFALGKAAHRVFGMLPLRSTKRSPDVIRTRIVRRKILFRTLHHKFRIMAMYNMVKTHNVAKKLKVTWPTVDALVEDTAILVPTTLVSFINANILYFQNKPNINLMLARVGTNLVMKLGPKSMDLLRTLKIFGVNSLENTIGHAAVSWANLDLLKFIREEFSLQSIDLTNRIGKTILFIALESNPFLKWTPDGFWPMMEYLIQHVDVLDANRRKIREIIDQGINTVSPVTWAIPPDYQALVSDDGQFTDEDIRIAKAKFQCVPLQNWDLTNPYKCARRYAVIKHASMYLAPEIYPDDYVTVSEIIIKHRGIDTLSDRSQRAYENTVFQIIKNEMNNFNPNQMQRVFTNILQNVQTRSELIRMKNMYLNYIHPNIEQAWYHQSSYHKEKIDELFNRREQNLIIPDSLPSNTPKIWGIKTRMDVNPILIDDLGSQLQPIVDWNNYNEWRQACAEKFLSL